MTEMWSRMLAWGSGVLGRSGGAGRLQGAAEGVLPVNLGSYDYARSGSAQGKIQNIDQTLVWVVVALLAHSVMGLPASLRACLPAFKALLMCHRCRTACLAGVQVGATLTPQVWRAL